MNNSKRKTERKKVYTGRIRDEELNIEGKKEKRKMEKERRTNLKYKEKRKTKREKK